VIGAEYLLNNGTTLALAAGELDGIEAGFVEKLEVVEIFDDFVARDFGVFFFLTGGEKEIRHDRAMFEKGIVLGDDANLTGLYGAILAVDRDSARSGFVETGDDAKELGFADAARTEEADDLALNAVGTDDVFNFGAHMIEDRTTVVLERDILDF
jgi:hypothetical protein